LVARRKLPSARSRRAAVTRLARLLRQRRWVLAGLLLALAVLSRVLPPTTATRSLPAQTVSGTVMVLDGDTVRLPDGERLRLASIDTAEHGRPFASEATAFVRDRLAGREIRVRPSPEGRDHYGRLLGDLEVDGLSLSALLVEHGLAVVIDPDATGLLANQRQAVSEQRGMHVRNARAEGPFALTRGRFHRLDCRLRGKSEGEQVATAGEALLAGRGPCRSCLPWPP